MGTFWSEHPKILFNQFQVALPQLLGGNFSLEEILDLYAQIWGYAVFDALFINKAELVGEKEFRLFDETMQFIVVRLPDICTFASGQSFYQKLQALDIPAIISEWEQSHKTDDPFVHFYQYFLSNYDSPQRKQLGMFYTPKSIASFIVKSVDSLLKIEFQHLNGIMTPSIHILDPAIGTGIFILQVIKNGAIQRRKGQNSKEDLSFPHLYGLEFSPAPLLIARSKITRNCSPSN